MLKAILQILFPIHCLLCEESEGNYLCDKCESKLTRREQECIVCQRRSPITCADCATKYTPDAFYAPYTYRSGLRSSLQKAKFSGSKKIFEHLGQRLADLVEPHPDHIITAIPLHKSKLRSRGFNQSEVIAKKVSTKLNIPYQELLKRTKKTQEQKKLTVDKRAENLKDAFAVADIDVSGLKILLIDDIVTTGATVLQATKVLKKAGAVKVTIVALASDR